MKYLTLVEAASVIDVGEQRTKDFIKSLFYSGHLKDMIIKYKERIIVKRCCFSVAGTNRIICSQKTFITVADKHSQVVTCTAVSSQ